MTTAEPQARSTHRLNLPDGTGKAGEAAALHILEQHGYKILRTNYRVPEGEIDVVSTRDDQIVFVEVKTRRGSSFGRPEESLTPSKSLKLISAAQSYLLETGQSSRDWRIDLLAIVMDRSGKVVRSYVIENAVTE